jgi:hypothetical protein
VEEAALFVISLIVSALLLLLANLIVRRARFPGAAMACASVAFVLGPLYLRCLLPPVLVQAPLLLLAAIVWSASRRGPSHFLSLSGGATLLAYACTIVFVLQADRDVEQLGKFYRYRSMSGRVPGPKHGPTRLELPAAAETRLAAIEARVGEEVSHWREFRLMILHEYTVRRFVDSPGAGNPRMPIINDWGLNDGISRGASPLQPGSRSEVLWSLGDSRPRTSGDQAPLGRLLESSILEFVHPQGFGYFKDRRHVAGFDPHRFVRLVPSTDENWVVQRLELVSLLLHEEPAVYVAERLPVMDETHGTPTRPLDRFEQYGLDALGRGEDLFVSESGDRLRMLGAVRSAKQCLACHGGRRGDLLGAFSYTLKPAVGVRPKTD